jgi:hypothetical protein
MENENGRQWKKIQLESSFEDNFVRGRDIAFYQQQDEAYPF